MEEDGEILLQEKAQLKARGNWTLNYPKKTLRIKFEKKQNLLGLNGGREYKNWVLLAENTLALIDGLTRVYAAEYLTR